MEHIEGRDPGGRQVGSADDLGNLVELPRAEAAAAMAATLDNRSDPAVGKVDMSA
jgi:hypothetical protein